jgi:peptidoglycan/LPS O-acetylase OafA/YrhL
MASAPPAPAGTLASLEGLRFISSLMIVAGHYVPYVTPTPLIARLHLAVDLFFVISGIVIAERYAGKIRDLRDWAAFMIKRIARLYPLHLATLGFYVAIGVLVWSGKLHPNDATRYNPAEIIPNLLLVQAWRLDSPISFNYVSWSISAEFFVYLLFPLVLALVGRRALPAFFGILVVTALFAWIAETEVGRPLTKLDWRGGVLRAVPSFAFGTWLHCHLRATPLPAARLRLLVHGLLGAVAVLMLLRVNEYALLGVIWLLVASAYAADRCGVATWVSAPWLARRGQLTYSIYMLHTVVATVLLAVVFPKLLGTSPGARLAGVLMALPALYLVSVLSLRWFETPMRRWIGSTAEPFVQRGKTVTKQQ